MNRFRHITGYSILLGLFAIAAVLTGCGGGGGGGSTAAPGQPVAVSGYVLKGSVEGATVYVRPITSTGALGASIAGPFTTDANGRWSGEVPAGTSGIHAVTASGGSYTDESTGNTVNVVSEIRGIINVGQGNVGNVTPITEALFINATYRMQLGASKTAAFADAIGDMTTALGFDPASVVPSAGASALPTAAQHFTDMDMYSVILAGFAELLNANPALGPAFDNAETWEIVKAVATDMSDGKLDGIDIVGNAILVDDGSGTGTLLPLPPLSPNDISNLIAAANDWAAVNAPDIVIPDIDLAALVSFKTCPTDNNYTVSGSIMISGPDASKLTDSNSQVLFTPTSVMVMQNVFLFCRNNIYNTISVEAQFGRREVDSIRALAQGTIWSVTADPDDPVAPWVPGAWVSPSGSSYIINFTDVGLDSNTTNSGSEIILNDNPGDNLIVSYQP